MLLGAELVVGLTHRLIFEDSLTLLREPRLHAILGGHEHDGRRMERDGRLLVKDVSDARTVVPVTFTREGSGAAARWRDTLTRRIGPDRVLGIAPEPINAVDSISKRESRFGNMITDVMRTGTNSDVAIIISGALRFDGMMADGPIPRHMADRALLGTCSGTTDAPSRRAIR